MNSVIVAVIGIALLSIGYKFYGKLMVKLWQVDVNQTTSCKD